jgi:hypothetical protein
MFRLGISFAHVGGGFFYIIGTTVKGALERHTEDPRYAQHALVSRLSLISSADVLW